jgi:hypothetical protein
MNDANNQIKTDINNNNNNNTETNNDLKRNEKRHTLINPGETSLEKPSFPSEAKKRNTINFSTNSPKIKNILNPNNEEETKQKDLNFLSKMQLKLFTILDDFLYGLGDSLQIFNIFGIIKSSERMMLNLRNCIFLNGLILISSNIFYLYFLDPWLNYYVNSLSNFSYFFFNRKIFLFYFLANSDFLNVQYHNSVLD